MGEAKICKRSLSKKFKHGPSHVGLGLPSEYGTENSEISGHVQYELFPIFVLAFFLTSLTRDGSSMFEVDHHVVDARATFRIDLQN